MPIPLHACLSCNLQYVCAGMYYLQVEARDDAAGADRRAASAQQQAQARQQELVRPYRPASAIRLGGCSLHAVGQHAWHVSHACH